MSYLHWGCLNYNPWHAMRALQGFLFSWSPAGMSSALKAEPHVYLSADVCTWACSADCLTQSWPFSDGSDLAMITKRSTWMSNFYSVISVDFTTAFFNTYWHVAYAGSECSALCHENCITHTLSVTWACCRKSFSNTCVCLQLCLNKAAFSGLWMHYSARCVNCAASGYESVSETQWLALALRVNTTRIHPSYNKRNKKNKERKNIRTTALWTVYIMVADKE